MIPRRHRLRQAASRSGFSLFELLMVLAVIGMLSTAAVPAFTDVNESARLRRSVAELESIWLSQRVYRLETGRFAETVKELQRAELIPGNQPGMIDGYQFLIRRDALGRPRMVARREGSDQWSGELSMDSLGRMRGELRKRDGQTKQP
jgi:prepilin-type N-terminal cleavage/methylation domain-containing protein